jgi:hypothetical protein
LIFGEDFFQAPRIRRKKGGLAIIANKVLMKNPPARAERLGVLVREFDVAAN